MNAKKKFDKTHLRFLYVLLPVISAVNFVLPFLAKFTLNKLLRRTKNYYGHVDGVSFSSFGKLIKVKGLYFDKKNSANEQTRFLSAETITIEIDRTALWKGFVVLSTTIDYPEVSYVKEKSKAQRGIKEFSFNADIPVVLIKAEITNGKAEYIDTTCQPVVELKATNLNITGTNLSNTPDPDVLLPTEITMSGKILGGRLYALIKTDLSQKEPTFDLNAELKGMNLVQMNNFFKAYGKFDVNKGTLSLFTEVAAREGKFKGYVKPVVLDLDVVGPEDYDKNFLNVVWQSLIGAAAEIFQNQKEDELATKIPFSGTFRTPHANVSFAVAEVFYNAFVEALKPSIDYEININSVKKKV